MEPVTQRDADLHQYLISCMTHAMESAGIDLSLAKSIADQVDLDIRHHFGGDRPYVRVPSKRERNRKIIKRWNAGISRVEIARQLEIAESTVSRVINAQLNSRREGFGTAEWNL